MNNNLDIVLSDEIKLIQKAYDFCCCDFSHEEIINELSLDNEIKKQLCIINLKEVKNQNEANLLLSNLTNKGGPIREVSAYKINELIKNEKYTHLFQSREILNTFIKAINDVNPNVSRSIVEIVYFIDDKEFLINELYNRIFSLFEEIDQIETAQGQKSHVTTKKSFNLYWCLEAIIQLTPALRTDKNLEKILSLASEYNEYPIREKAAKILSCLNQENSTIRKLIENLKKDCNMYVRRYLL